MGQTFEEPITTDEGGVGRTGQTRTEHPCFAQISASRVSGSAHLYASDFQHQHYMTVSIHRSQLMRDLSRDWHFSREEYIEVAMSEAQWATFISTPNTAGVPCTLARHNGKLVPGLPPPAKRSHQFRHEVIKTMESSLQQLNELDQLIKDSGLSEKKAKALMSMANMVRGGINGSLGFVADQFDEHMEKTTERAKVEISAYATAAIHRAGLQAIAGTLPVLSLPGHGALNTPLDSEGGEA